ncbi:hypothetical protein [Acinetobacter ursingii]|uniref:hypothetical protein n=1 Tax=Acinetobacter ursingii TaxID=108980 RepID=UPI0006671B15|nr:hypothetical protein [Acinetobacter ursingii]MCH2004375.1 hypothetical protein [Acinetobacter ursingii]MCU4610590.1 hypothetical protein [Acinetobacter ursingii]
MESNESTPEINHELNDFITTRPAGLITEEDLFKVLKKRYHQKFKARLGVEKIHNGVFYETICMLENLEITLTAIHSGNYPTSDEYIAAKNDDEKKKIINFYWSLTIDKELLEYAVPDYHFSKQVTCFRKFLIFYQRKNQTKDTMPFWRSEERWDISNFPEQQVFDIIEQYVALVESDKNTLVLANEKQEEREETLSQTAEDESTEANPLSADKQPAVFKGLEKSIFKTFDNTVAEFRRLITRHEKLSVICIDIISGPSANQKRYDIDAVWKKRDSIYSFFNALNPVFGLVASFSRLEFGVKGKVVQQNILLFSVDKNKNPVDFRRVEAALKEIAEKRFARNEILHTEQFEIDKRNFTETIASFDKIFPHKNKHILKLKNESALRKFEYWFLGYFHLVDFYLKPDVSSYADAPFVLQYYQEGIVAESRISSLMGPEKPQQKKDKQGRNQRVSEATYLKDYWQDKSLEKITYIPKKAIHELKLVHFVYSEFSDLYFRDKKDKENEIKMLFLIEYFSRVIQHNSFQNLTNSSLSLDVKRGNPHKHLSLAEKLLIAIYQYIYSDQPLWFNADEQEIVGWRVKHFQEVYKDLRISNRSIITNINGYLTQFKEGLSWGGQNDALLKQEALESIKATKNAVAARDYLNKKINSDIFVLRFDFGYDLNSAYSKQKNAEAFNQLFTDFLKNLKRVQIDLEEKAKDPDKKAKTLKSELIAHIGSRYFLRDKLHIDVTFIFDAQSLSDLEENKIKKMIDYVENEILRMWRSYKANKTAQMDAYDQKNFKENPTKESASKKGQKAETKKFRELIQHVGELRVSSVRLDFPRHIKQHDTKNLHSFKTIAINFYTAHALLCTWKGFLHNLKDAGATDSNWLSMEQFIKGRLPKEKKKISEAVVDVEQEKAELSEVSMSDTEDASQSSSSDVESVIESQGDGDKEIQKDNLSEKSLSLSRTTTFYVTVKTAGGSEKKIRLNAVKKLT